MRSKLIALILIVVCIFGILTGCGKECANGCGNSADTKCMAEMCDKCCDYWMGLNGCYRNH